jgi:hypothetical protein
MPQILQLKKKKKRVEILENFVNIFFKYCGLHVKFIRESMYSTISK